MAKDNMSIYVILGMLSIKPMSGYEIKYWISVGVGHFWNISYGQIYPNLKRLEQEGLASCITEKNESRPDKKVYSIKEEGRAALINWLSEPIDFCGSVKGNLLLLKLYLGSATTPDVILRHVQDYKKHMTSKLEQLDRLDQDRAAAEERAARAGDPSYPYRMLALDQGLMVMKAQIAWCDQTIESLERRISEAKNN